MIDVSMNVFCLKSANLMSFSELNDIDRSNFDARSNLLFNENLFDVISVTSEKFFEKILITSSCI